MQKAKASCLEFAFVRIESPDGAFHHAVWLDDHFLGES
jgi:hypothetical protein